MRHDTSQHTHANTKISKHRLQYIYSMQWYNEPLSSSTTIVYIFTHVANDNNISPI